MSTHISTFFRVLCFAQFKPSVFVYYQQPAFPAALSSFQRVKYRLAILSFVLRALRAVFCAFDSLVVCLYGLILKLIVGRSTGFIRNVGFQRVIVSPSAVSRPGYHRQPVQLSGLAFSFSDIGIIGSASRLYQLHNYIKYLKYIISII